MRGWGPRGGGGRMGGGRRGWRGWPDPDSSPAPSLGSSPRPHFPPPLTPSSILCGPSVLTPRAVPLPSLGVVTTFPGHPGNFLRPRTGVRGCFVWARFSRGSLGGSLRGRAAGSQRDARTPQPAPQLADRRASASSRPLSPNHDRNEREGERTG